MKKKILFVMDTMYSGGSQKILLNCLDIFSEKYDVELLLINRSGSLMKDIKKNIKVIDIFSKYKQLNIRKLFQNKYSLLEKIRIFNYKFFIRGNIYLNFLKYKSNKKIRHKKYEYIIGFQEGPSNYIVANLNVKGKKIGWLHSDINKLTKSQTKMERNVYEKLNLIIAVSHAVKENAEKKYIHLKGKIKVLYNPIKVDAILKKSKENCNELDKKMINLVTVGRLSQEKGYFELIKSLKVFLLRSGNINLYIIGEGPEKDRLEKYIKKNGLINKVILLGFQNNPYKFIKNSSIYISSSVYEGLPTTIIEAMILKRKIVATKIVATDELLKSYPLKKYVDLEDFSEFPKQIESLLKDDSKELIVNLEPFQYNNFIKNFYTLTKE